MFRAATVAPDPVPAFRPTTKLVPVAQVTVIELVVLLGLALTGS